MVSSIKHSFSLAVMVTTLYFRPFFCKTLKSLPGNSPGNGLCSKVKDSLPFALPNSPDSRKYGGHRFSHSCRRLDKDLSACQNGMVNTAHHLPLAFPIRKWKLQALKRFVSLFFPLLTVAHPFVISIQQLLVPVWSTSSMDKVSRETPDHFCVQIRVGHLYPNFLSDFPFCP